MKFTFHVLLLVTSSCIFGATVLLESVTSTIIVTCLVVYSAVAVLASWLNSQSEITYLKHNLRVRDREIDKQIAQLSEIVNQ